MVSFYGLPVLPENLTGKCGAATGCGVAFLQFFSCFFGCQVFNFLLAAFTMSTTGRKSEELQEDHESFFQNTKCIFS